jgi:hypothetical protein
MDKTNVVNTDKYECVAHTATQLMARLAVWLNA